MSKLLRTTAPPATLLVRLLVGAVFLSEGIQKLLFPDAQGAGRFAMIGIPAPDVVGPFVGRVEIVCGVLLLIGLLTRLAAIPLIIDISVAIVSTKTPDLARSRNLAIQSAEIGELRFLEHGPRGAHGFLHVGRQPVSADCGRRKKVVGRRAAD